MNNDNDLIEIIDDNGAGDLGQMPTQGADTRMVNFASITPEVAVEPETAQANGIYDVPTPNMNLQEFDSGSPLEGNINNPINSVPLQTEYNEPEMNLNNVQYEPIAPAKESITIQDESTTDKGKSGLAFVIILFILLGLFIIFLPYLSNLI